jgi:hypothetical protein
MNRTPQDYAIEHAEYMAKAAEAFMEASDVVLLLECKRATSTVDPDAMRMALDLMGEARRKLAMTVYEFRKRRDRAAAPAETVPCRPARPPLPAMFEYGDGK